MGLASIFKQRVLAIDNSTLSCAWALFEGEVLIDHGEVNFVGANTYERLTSMADALTDLKKLCSKVNVICIEKTIYAQSRQTAILLGMASGAVISHLSNVNTKIIEISPITWQSFIGNKLLTTLEKNQIKKNNPGKSVSWLKGEYRRVRKQRTVDFIKNKFGIVVENDNQSDSIGLGYYMVMNK